MKAILFSVAQSQSLFCQSLFSLSPETNIIYTNILLSFRSQGCAYA
jgi:hypothetical protein